MNLLTKLRLLAQLNQTEKEVEEGIKMKNSTKVIAAIVGLLTSLMGIPAVQVAVGAFLTAHPVVSALIAALSTLLALIHTPKATIAALLLAVALTMGPRVQAQSVQPDPISNLYGVGVAVNTTPTGVGSVFYAHNINDGGTYAFTNLLIVPTGMKPFTVTNNIGVGIAQKVTTIRSIPIFCPTTAGISWTGVNTGFQYNGGCLAAFHLKNGLYIMPGAGFIKSSVSSGAGYQPIVAVHFAFGN